MIINNEITDAKTVAGILLAENNKGRDRNIRNGLFKFTIYLWYIVIFF